MIFTKKNMFFFLFIAVFIACCVFSNKVFAEEDVSLSVLNGATVASNVVVSSDSSRNICYFLTNNDYIYTITSNFTSPHSFWVSQYEPSVGSQLTYLVALNNGESYTFVGNSRYYISTFSNDLNDRIVVTSRAVNEYDNTIDNLSQAISLDNLWGQFGVGLIAVGVLFAIGFFVVRKVLKKDSQYKG